MANASIKKNEGKIECEKCGSVIFLSNTATWTKIPEGIFLPPMKSSDKEGVKEFTFWTVSDMFAFENVGFCNTVENIKYLACADCEIGPIGAHLLSDKTKFYISPSRVKHLATNDQAICLKNSEEERSNIDLKIDQSNVSNDSSLQNDDNL